MMDYKKLVEALRICAGFVENPSCAKCSYSESTRCKMDMMQDAADAIEDLEGFLAEAERDRDEYEERMRKEQERVIELQAEADALAHDIERYVGINAELTTEIEELEAKNKELHGRIEDEELKIDMLTADSTNYEIAIEELKAQLPKRGQYVHGRELSREYIGDCLVSIDYEDWRCSVCGIVFEQWSIPKYNYCPNCGAKMEVQDDKA